MKKPKLRQSSECGSNQAAKALASPLFRQKIVKARKGKTSYTRRLKHKNSFERLFFGEQLEALATMV